MAALVKIIGQDVSNKPYQIKKLQPITLTIRNSNIRFITKDINTKAEAK